MSILAWFAFGICFILVIIHFFHDRDVRFLLIAFPMLLLILIIPMILAKMSRKTYARADAQYVGKTEPCRISDITLQKIGESAEIRGIVEKVSFKWLNRPHFQIDDGTGKIKVIIFTSPSDDIRVGDKVKVRGMIMRSLFGSKAPIISAISVKKT
ncbi:MAG: hypothetical protein J7J70_04620 [Deltaproteobacteria bacterium]|nr:hypothetical protein [Candidatus Tharpellaceae bacterium]